ncbi:MAG: alcohol dehydrogenase catalytic domain-containing protein [Chloroflexota bacterium]|nr:alcohol dehydrogenase catalytic domain-containing protein [Dehalococcoidia bacterium]MDW8253551.1 alcohol dehydrogenase catalytic domain-containing protein [Chloroflexota bacterium]
MRAVLFDGEIRLKRDYPDPAPPPGEALIRVRLAGICNTDLEIARGYLQFRGVLGHEFVGEVVAAAEPGWIGRRVVGEINASCRACARCAAGDASHCAQRTVLGIQGRDGAFADFLCLPLANLHRLPDTIADEEALFVEPLAAAFEIVDRVQVRPTDRVLVLGDGKLGQLVARVLAATSAQLTVVGRHEEKLAILRAAGIDACRRDELPAIAADIVVDCTGTAAGFQDALQFTRPRGTIVLKSTVAEALPLNLAPVVINEVTVVGSRCGPFAPAIRALADRRIEVTPLLTAIYPLDEALAAFQRAQAPGVLKVALRP